MISCGLGAGFREQSGFDGSMAFSLDYLRQPTIQSRFKRQFNTPSMNQQMLPFELEPYQLQVRDGGVGTDKVACDVPVTRLYFSGVLTSPVSPTYDAWDDTSKLWHGVAETALANGGSDYSTIYALAGASTQYLGFGQFVYGPIIGQTISGNLRGQIQAMESDVAFNGSIAISVRTMYLQNSTWYVRGTNLAKVAAPYLNGTPPEFAVTTPTNRQFMDASGNTSIALTPVVAQSGDYIVIEIGVAETGTSTSLYARPYVQDQTASVDLPMDNTTTTLGNPWIEIGNLKIGKAVGISDGGTGSETFKKGIVQPDSGIGTDNLSGLANKFTVADNGLGSDLLATLKNKFTIADSGIGTDVLASLTNKFTKADSGAGSDGVNVAIQQSNTYVNINDSGVGTTVPVIQNKFTKADSGTGTDIVSSLKNKFGINDNGTGSDVLTSLKKLFTISDSGTGTDTYKKGIKQSDSGAGTDAILSLKNLFTKADSGTGTDAIKKGIKQSDSGVGTDALSNLTVKFTIADSGHGTDILASLKNLFTKSDSGTGTDGISLKNLFTKADTGTGSDAISLKNLFAKSDSGTGTNTVAVKNSFTKADSGIGTDVIASVKNLFTKSDSGIGTDTFKKGIKQSDSGSGSDGLAVKNSFTKSDSGIGTDLIASIKNLFSKSDSGIGSDGLNVGKSGGITNINLSDSGVGSIIVAIKNSFSKADSGTGSNSIAVKNTLSKSDSVTGTDAISPIKKLLTKSDMGVGTDIISSLVNKFTKSDSGIGTDIVSSLKNKLSLTDSGHGTDLPAVTYRQLRLFDTGLGTESLGMIRKFVEYDTAVGSDNILFRTIIAISDYGIGDDEIDKLFLVLYLNLFVDLDKELGLSMDIDTVLDVDSDTENSFSVTAKLSETLSVEGEEEESEIIKFEGW